MNDDLQLPQGFDPALLYPLPGRRAAQEAAFFLPYIHSGMSVLDVGCGPGSITLDLAEHIAPATVTGVDLLASHLDTARAQAQRRGIANVAFTVGDAYQLPFPSASFDAGFAHALLYQLEEPLAALDELYRVIKPGGVVGLRDSDFAGSLHYPGSRRVDQAMVLVPLVIKELGGDPQFGRRQRTALLDAGFRQVTVTATFDVFATESDAAALAEGLANYLTSERVASLIIGNGWATASDIRGIPQALKIWANDPEALAVQARFEAVGRR